MHACGAAKSSSRSIVWFSKINKMEGTDASALPAAAIAATGRADAGGNKSDRDPGEDSEKYTGKR